MSELSVAEKTALQRASVILGNYAALIRAFATHGGEWSQSAEGKKAQSEFNEAVAIQKTLRRIASNRAVEVDGVGMAKLRGGDI